MIYIIADTHFGHANIIRHCNRPFSSVEEMDEALIANWNSVVSPDDDVYIVGDFAYKVEHPERYADMLNGRKHLITGNHDRKNLKDPEFRKRFVEIRDMLTIKHDGKSIVLCHYPLVEWDGMYRGAYHFFGHIHNNENQAQKIMRGIAGAYNVGVENMEYTPRTIDEIIDGSRGCKKEI